MSDPGYKCVKCGHETVRGYLADYSENKYFLAKWVEGEPVRSTFLGLTGVNVDTRDKRSLDVRALRCNGCGFLEFYAI